MEESWLRQVGNVATDTVLVTSLGVKSVKPWAKRDTNLPRTKFELEWRQKECAWTTLESVKQRWVTWDNILQIKTTTESISWSRMCTMAYQVWQTFLSGARLKHHPVPSALEKDPSNTSSAACKGPYRKPPSLVAPSGPESSCRDSCLSHHRLQTPPSKEEYQLHQGLERHNPSAKICNRPLGSAAPWQLKADLGKQLRFPDLRFPCLWQK